MSMQHHAQEMTPVGHARATRWLLALVVMPLLVLALAGCGGGQGSSGPLLAQVDGSYEVPSGWVVYEPESTSEKVFYVREGDSSGLPDNISVEQGTSKYLAAEAPAFGQAAAQQMIAQLEGTEGWEVAGQGTYTANDDYLVIITTTEVDCVTTQYYILADNKYVLVHETNYSGGADCDEAAQAIVDSFSWDE